jgi:hypothetical protein
MENKETFEEWVYENYEQDENLVFYDCAGDRVELAKIEEDYEEYLKEE